MKKTIQILTTALFLCTILLGITLILVGLRILHFPSGVHRIRYIISGAFLDLMAIIGFVSITFKISLKEMITAVPKLVIICFQNFNKIYAAIIFFFLIIIYFLVWGRLASMPDTAYFGGDTWEYQSMAVNFAKGHGIQKFGGLEAFKVYKFQVLDSSPRIEDFVNGAGTVDVYRTPAYPFLLGIVYKIFGVSPRIAKYLQLLLLVIIAASLPLIGYRYWGKIGYLSGFPAGILYLARNSKLAEDILTEPLIAFAVFLVLLALIAFEYRPRLIIAILLGISFGFASLVKGSLIFIPIIVCVILLADVIIKKNFLSLKHLLVILVSMALIILPWSIYASIKSGESIFLSSEGSSLLLADNNENCVDGGWHPEWATNKASFYNNDGINNNNAIEKVVNFYWHNPVLFPRCMAAKFLGGFGPMIFLWIFAGTLLFSGFFRIVGQWKRSNFFFNLTGLSLKQIPLSFWVIGGNFLLITLIFHAQSAAVPSRFVTPMDFIFSLLCCASIITLFSKIFLDKKELNSKT